ncbi:MAG: CDP-alcohol phosphatidyltransferase family protein [Eubacteriales bacterium]
MKELFKKIFKKMHDELFTVPNMLSIFRLLLIPVIVYTYIFAHENILTVVLIAISSISDMIDGYIARKFNMITDFGKFLDPLADKATQITVIACLITKFKLMILPCVVLFVKELSSLLLRLEVFKKTEKVECAKWHGKASTVLLVIMMALHIALPDFIAPAAMSTFSAVSIIFCTLFMLFSFTLYTIDALKLIHQNEN